MDLLPIADAVVDRAIVALSGDGLTNGHLDLFERAAQHCRKELVVLIAVNEAKKTTFTLAEREIMAARAIRERGIPKCRVISSDGLLVDVILEEGCDALFRGVRDEEDLRYEEKQARVNAMILPMLKDRIFFIEADADLQLVSSSLIKTLTSFNVDAHQFVPMFVKQALEERMLDQYRIGLTGGIATGKTWVGAELAKQARLAGITATHLNVDQLLRDFYDEPTNGAQIVRDQLHKRFRGDILLDGGKRVNRKRLAEIIFRATGDRDRDFVTDLTRPYVDMKYRKALRGLKGLVIVEWAQLAEMDMGSWTNNNVIVVDSPDREAFFTKRGIDAARIREMDAIQLSAGLKSARLAKRAAKDKSGTVIAYENRIREDEAASAADIATLLAEVRERCVPAMPTTGGAP